MSNILLLPVLYHNHSPALKNYTPSQLFLIRPKIGEWRSRFAKLLYGHSPQCAGLSVFLTNLHWSLSCRGKQYGGTAHKD